MSKFKLWLGVLMVFILGVLIGSFGVSKYHQHRFGDIMGPGPMPFPPKAMLSRLLNSLDRELELTVSQQKKIRIILEDAINSFEKFRAEYNPEMISIKEKADSRIKALLTPEQIKKFNEMTERFSRHRPPPPPGSDFHEGMMDGPPPEFMMERIEKQLHLKPEQKEKVHIILDENRFLKREAFMELKFGEIDTPGTVKKRMIEINKETEKKLQPILDAEQMNRYKKMQNGKMKQMQDMDFPG
jgi:hypothetical protein